MKLSSNIILPALLSGTCLLKPVVAQSVDTLFVGDSDIALWDDTNSNFPGSINVGVGGYTCDEVNSDIDAHLATYMPKKVVIVCGENDLWGQNAARTFGDFKVVIDKIIASGASALYLGTKPEPSTKSLWNKYQQYDAMVFDYANTLATNALPTVAVPLTVIDVHAAFVDIGNPRSLYDSDRLHLSSDGYAYWNTWTAKAFDNSANGCVRWKNGVCEVTNDTTTTTTTTTTTATTNVPTAMTYDPTYSPTALATDADPGVRSLVVDGLDNSLNNSAMGGKNVNYWMMGTVLAMLLPVFSMAV